MLFTRDMLRVKPIGIAIKNLDKICCLDNNRSCCLFRLWIQKQCSGS